MTHEHYPPMPPSRIPRAALPPRSRGRAVSGRGPARLGTRPNPLHTAGRCAVSRERDLLLELLRERYGERWAIRRSEHLWIATANDPAPTTRPPSSSPTSTPSWASW